MVSLVCHNSYFVHVKLWNKWKLLRNRLFWRWRHFFLDFIGCGGHWSSEVCLALFQSRWYLKIDIFKFINYLLLFRINLWRKTTQLGWESFCAIIFLILNVVIIQSAISPKRWSVCSTGKCFLCRGLRFCLIIADTKYLFGLLWRFFLNWVLYVLFQRQLHLQRSRRWILNLSYLCSFCIYMCLQLCPLGFWKAVTSFELVFNWNRRFLFDFLLCHYFLRSFV